MLRGATELALLRSGLELGLFEALRAPQGAEALAERLGLAGDLVAAWLRAADAHGLLRAAGERFALSPFARWLLDAPESAALHAALDQAALSWLPRLAALPELMKGAERPSWGSAEEARRTAALSRLLEARALGALARVPGVAGARRVLDVGCGEGTLSRGLPAASPRRPGRRRGARPRLAEQARRTLREAQVSRRGEIRAGDFLTLDLGAEGFDLALLNQSLHYFAPAERAALFRRIREQLAPGGVVAIQTRGRHPRSRLAPAGHGGERRQLRPLPALPPQPVRAARPRRRSHACSAKPASPAPARCPWCRAGARGSSGGEGGERARNPVDGRAPRELGQVAHAKSGARAPQRPRFLIRRPHSGLVSRDARVPGGGSEVGMKAEFVS